MLSLTNVLRGLIARPTMAKRTHRPARPLRLECLEERTLLSAGDLDLSFGSGGIVTTDFGNYDHGKAVAIQTDGKIVVGGSTTPVGVSASEESNFVVVRYNANGSLDTSFGSQGSTTTNFPKIQGFRSFDTVSALAIQSDGKILAVGTSGTGILQSTSYFAIARYNSNGTLDKSFGAKGFITTNILGRYNRAFSVAIQSDGKIVVAGASDPNCCTEEVFAVVRYLPNGNLDTTFDGDGKLTINVGGSLRTDFASQVAIQADGRIVVAGTADTAGSGHDANFAIVRLNANGSLDSSFGASGQVITDVGATTEWLSGLAITSDQRIVVTGWVEYDPYQANHTIALVRYNSDGSLDSSFDGDGIVTTEIGPGEDHVGDIAIQSDGKIVITGSTEHGPNTKDFVVLRYNIDGSLDTSFGGTGIVTTGVGSRDDSAFAVAIQSDGKIVVAGDSHNGTNTDIALARYYA